MMRTASAPLGRPEAAKVATGAGWGLLILSMIVLVGWAFDLRGLENFVAESAGTKANSAAAMMLAAVALLRRDHRDLPIFSISVSLIGALTLAEYFWHTNFGIDELLFRDTHYFFYPGRMSQYTSIGLVLLGASLLPMNSRHPSMRQLSRYLGVLTGSLGALAIVSHAYDRHAPNLVHPGTNVAIPTAIGFVIGAIGVQYANSSEGIVRLFHADNPGGAMLRRLLPAGLLLSVLLGFAVVHAQVHYHWEAGFSLALVSVGVGACLVVGIVLTAANLEKQDLARRESEQRFLLAEKAAPVMVWVSGTDKLCTYFSEPWLKFTGRSIETELGNGWAEGVHRDDLQRCLDTYTQAFDRREEFRMEYRLRRHDGEYRWILDIGAPRFDQSPSFLGYIGIAIDVTERKLVEETLRESEARFQDLAEQSRTTHWEVDPQGLFTYVSQMSQASWGYRPDEVMGRMHFYDIHPEEGREAFKAAVFAVVERKQPFRDVVHAMETKDGRIAWGSTNGIPLVNADGTLRGYRGSCTDVTDRKLAEEVRRQSEEQFRTLAEAIPQLCWMAHGDGHGFWNNQRWYSYTGTTPEQMEGWGWQSVHDPQTLPTVLTRWNASIAKGEPFEMVSPLRSADGIFRPFLTRVMPLKDADGRVVRWFGTSTDVTELRDAHEKRYRQLFENMSEGIAYCRMLFDDSGRPADFVFLDVNSAFPTLTGLKDVVGKGMTELIPGIRESNPELFETCGRVAVTGQPEKLEVEIRSLGTWLSTSVHSPERDHFMAVFDNITERKRSEERLLRAEKLASVGRMAAAIAHEINNPLDAVMNLLFLVGTTKDLPESVRHLLETADDELKRVAHITRQSLGFYRESGAPTLTPVSAVLNSAVDLVKSRIKVKQAIIEKQFDGDVQITAIPGELRQVFSNLLSNSLDAINERGVIKLRVSAARHRIRVTIADNGKGVPESIRRRIFEPFFSTKGAVGTGLGLWVSQQIIEKHGGTIRVRSSSDGLRRGTTFSVELPLGPMQPESQLTVTLADVGDSRPADR